MMSAIKWLSSTADANRCFIPVRIGAKTHAVLNRISKDWGFGFLTELTSTRIDDLAVNRVRLRNVRRAIQNRNGSEEEPLRVMMNVEIGQTERRKLAQFVKKLRGTGNPSFKSVTLADVIRTDLHEFLRRAGAGSR